MFVYLNRYSGEFVLITDEDRGIIESGEDTSGYPEWHQSTLKETRLFLENEDDYIGMPSKFDIHEYSIIERFCYTIENDELRDEMLFRIKGRGAFRMFKDGIQRYDIADDWYCYRQKAFEEIAIGWLEAHNIEYNLDTREEDPG